MCVIMCFQVVVILAISVLVVSGYSCPAGVSVLDLSSQLGTSTFPSLDQLGSIVSNRSSNTGIALNLTNNGITHIPPQVLSSPIFQKVVILELSGNRLVNLDSGLLDKFICVTKLDVSGNRLENISSDAFIHLEKLETLYLKNNSLLELPSGIFNSTNELSVIDASHNKIAKIGDTTFHTGLVALTEVDLSSNRLATFEPWPYISTIPYRKRRNFNLQHNQITRFTNNIGWTIKGEYISELTVDLRFNRLTHFRIDQFSQYLEGGKEPTVYDIVNFGFNVRNNTWYCDCGMYDVAVKANYSYYKEPTRDYLSCEGPSQLWGKEFGYFYEHPDELICNITDTCPAGCKCEDSPYRGYVLVDCSRFGQYTSLPEIVPDGKLFLQMSGNKLKVLEGRDYIGNISILDVSSNNIVRIEKSFMDMTGILEFMDIRNNSLEELPWKLQEFPLDSVRFTGNPIVCSCDSIWMNDWVRRYSQNMSAEELSRLLCRHDDQYSRLVDVTWESLVCYLDIAIGVSVALGLLLVILVVVTVLCWKHKYECKVLISNYFKFHPFDHAPCDKEDDATKNYDVYLSIDRENDDMRIWVKDELLKRLEKSSQSHQAYKVYYPCRQDDFGDSIVDQMVENINKSRRVLAVVNASYLKNGWSIEEFDHAHRLMEANSGRLLVLLYGDLDLSAVSQEPLKTYLTQRQCFSLTDKWVWRKIRYELPHKPISNLTSASRESLTSGISSIRATLSESSSLSQFQIDFDPDFVTTGVV